MKVLIVTPRSPFQGKGADEQDRLAGIKWFLGHSWEVRVITKVMPSDTSFIDEARKELGVPIKVISYKSKRNLGTILKRLINPHYWDGAAYEYFDKEIQEAVAYEIAQFSPDLVWFDYTYLWPLYSLVKDANIPIITRSINFEPSHFLDEDGRNPLNYIRSLPKLYSEYLTAKYSDLVFAITPLEEKTYQKLGAHTSTLPLRGLSVKLESAPAEPKAIRGDIILGFTASTYKVSHNREALLFLINHVMPKLSQNYVLYFTGSNLPDGIIEKLPSNCLYKGFVPKMDDFWNEVDIALLPSLFGHGMQQKVFEPLAKGLPTVASPRAIAGYPFEDGAHFISATTAFQFVSCVEGLAGNLEKRKILSHNSRKLSEEIFSSSRIDGIIQTGIKHVLHEKTD